MDLNLTDTVLAVKVPENETTALGTSNFEMHVKEKTPKKWRRYQVLQHPEALSELFLSHLNVNSVASLTCAPISRCSVNCRMTPFPWLNHGKTLTQWLDSE